MSFFNATHANWLQYNIFHFIDLMFSNDLELLRLLVSEPALSLTKKHMTLAVPVYEKYEEYLWGYYVAPGKQLDGTEDTAVRGQIPGFYPGVAWTAYGRTKTRNISGLHNMRRLQELTNVESTKKCWEPAMWDYNFFSCRGSLELLAYIEKSKKKVQCCCL